jgi:hypothetical protein
MKAKTPFKKPRTSPYQVPAFYWRGGDALREREYLSDEHRKALTEMRRAEQDLLRVRAETEHAVNVLRERDGYTSALVSFLDGDANGFRTENQLKEELSQLEREIVDTENVLREKRANQNPGIAQSLQKEKAYYQIDIERQIKAIENFAEEKQKAKQSLAELAITPKFSTAIYLEYQLDKLKRKKKYLRALVNRSKLDFDSATPVSAGQSPEARTCRSALYDGIEITMETIRAQEKSERRPQKHAAFINFLIEQVEDLNTRMIEVGMEADVEDVPALKQRYLNISQEVPNESQDQEPSDSNEVADSNEAADPTDEVEVT